MSILYTGYLYSTIVIFNFYIEQKVIIDIMTVIKEGEDYGDVLPSVMQTIRAASSLAAQDVNFYSSIDAKLGEQINKSGKNLMELANKLIQNSGDSDTEIKFGKDQISSELNWKPISDVLDGIFEKIDIAFDHAQKKPVNQGQYTYLEEGNDNSKAVGKRVTKPQASFKIPIDNTEEEPFKPKITSKPHAIIPFEQSTQLVPGSEDPAHYPQPYGYEIDNQPYPDSILSKSDPIPFQDWSSTSAIWVDSVETLNEMIENLRGCPEIAVDLEHHDYRTYYGLVCLMQISNRNQDWIVDTLALRDDLTKLNEIFADPNVIKVFHGAFMDIIWLQRDLGLYVVSLFDTYHASKKLGLSRFSLAYLLENFARFKTSKKYQLSDWRIRPLPPAMLAYARSDTHFLLNIFDQLKNKLLENQDDKMKQVLHESRLVAKRRFEYTKYRPQTSGSLVTCPVMSANPKEPYLSIMTQYNIPHSLKPMVEVLYNWRDVIAREEDESVRYVMPNQLLVNLATLSQPIDLQKVLSVTNYVTEYVRSQAQPLAELLDKTSKEVEQTDWELVDKWNDQQNDIDINDLNETTIGNYYDNFEKLLQQDNELLQNQSFDLINEDSKLFNDILTKDNVTLEFNVEANEVTKHQFNKVIMERFNKARASLLELDDNLKVEVQEQSTPEVAETVETVQPAEEKKPYKEDQNEIITLRKRQNQSHQPKKTTTPTENKDAVDYSNADKILLDVKRNFRDKTKQKRSFDPFMKESEGPKPAKKRQRMNAGKTSTFLNKRK